MFEIAQQITSCSHLVSILCLYLSPNRKGLHLSCSHLISQLSSLFMSSHLVSLG